MYVGSRENCTAMYFLEKVELERRWDNIMPSKERTSNLQS